MSGGAFWAGLFFVTAAHYHFSPRRNLALAAIMGGVYVLAALTAGRLSRGVAPRRVLAAAFGLWAAVAFLPALFPGAEAALWVAALVGCAAAAAAWPIVESYVAGGRHGAEMRRAIGWFNVTWTPATAVSLLIMPLVSRLGPTWLLGICGVVTSGAAVTVLTLPARPGAHEAEAASAAVGPEYSWLARTAAWLLPVSYMISSTLAPVLPHRLAAVGVTGGSPSVVAATWMAARFVALFVMWRAGFWHGRWETLAAGAAALAAGLAGVLLATTPAVLIGGLVLYGAGMGLTYYASLYYSMTVGHAAVEAGGNFEALIGVGYLVGPILGLLGRGAVGPERAGSATVALTCLVTALASPGAIRPYLEARRRRLSFSDRRSLRTAPHPATPPQPSPRCDPGPRGR